MTPPSLSKRVEATLTAIRERAKLAPQWSASPNQPLAEIEPVPALVMATMAEICINKSLEQLSADERLDITLGLLSHLGLQGFSPKALAHIAGVPERTVNQPMKTGLKRALIHHHHDLLPLIENVRQVRAEQSAISRK